METIIKVVKAVFFTEDGVDINFATKFKYVVYGMVLGAVLAVGGLLYLGDEDDTEGDASGTVAGDAYAAVEEVEQ